MCLQLSENADPEEIKAAGFDSYFVDHGTGVYPCSASGVPFNAACLASKGDPITDLNEDLAAEQKARTTYEYLMKMTDDPDVLEPLKFLREREIVHYQRFGEAKREDCSKKSTVLKAHKYSIFGNLLSIRKMQYLWAFNTLEFLLQSSRFASPKRWKCTTSRARRKRIGSATSGSFTKRRMLSYVDRAFCSGATL